MFDRVKPNYDIIRTKVEVELVGKNGDKFLVSKNINYEQKEQMAYELAAASFVIDEEEKAC